MICEAEDGRRSGLFSWLSLSAPGFPPIPMSSNRKREFLLEQSSKSLSFLCLCLDWIFPRIIVYGR